MTPGIKSGVSYEENFEKRMERQMGCLTGFLQMFDRHQILAGKRCYSAKRLSGSSISAESLSPSERSDVSSIFFAKAVPRSPSTQSVDACVSSPDNYDSVSSSLPFPLFEVKEGIKTSWKLRESPRLSLDSRAAFDARGKMRSREICPTREGLSGDSSDFSDIGHDFEKHRRSPSVVARLMGLDDFPIDCIEEQPKKSELRRSASESRVSRDLFQVNFQKSSPISDQFLQPKKVAYSESNSRALPVVMQRKSYFDAHEFFPEVNRAELMYGEIEKRLRNRGIEDPSKNFETLKQIIKALQLKGLLRTKPVVCPAVGLDTINNCVPQTSPVACPTVAVTNVPRKPPSASSRRVAALENLSSTKTLRNPIRKSTMKPPDSVRRRPVNVGRPTASKSDLRIHGFTSPPASPKRSEFYQVSARSSRIRHLKSEISPKEKNANMADCRTGHDLLERCDKLLYSISAITSSADQIASMDQQPSPVSVLDSNFLSEESSVSLLPKRSITFLDQASDWEDHRKNKGNSSSGSEFRSGSQDDFGTGQTDDYAYVADVVRETNSRGGPANIFSALEYRHGSACAGTSIPSVLHRRLFFDTVTEIIDRKHNVTSWSAFTGLISFEGPTPSDVWQEVQSLRQHASTENVMEMTGKVIKQDMSLASSREQEWTVLGMELSTAVLHIERLVFKDLVADVIQALADLARTRRATPLPRRKLVF